MNHQKIEKKNSAANTYRLNEKTSDDSVVHISDSLLRRSNVLPTF